ncbi:calcium-binding protein [Clostridium botulinum C]|uniref:Calcium-binding protein n=3 Tax=Clostridium botulinum TaxID=1491 RepID=A0A9Q4THH1_CLOBO|nr:MULTISPECIES: Ig-like domain-containing protein [Clostridium]EGO87679.1 calcium-binding protein [Clostridium botulinum C str. Stockholm]AYF55154.1 calcium-binding protein [Clostridium novyi]EES91342.1 hemolysin-type calcium-binding region [Clostridium botulinum D str. 1873]MBO3441715.1 calcium-binding protein [Clostridium haemolyticum]MCD3193957.1 calcium-binding protein [Clostridium botulinum C]
MSDNPIINKNNIKSRSTVFNPISSNFDEVTYKNFPVSGSILSVNPTDGALSYTLETPPTNGFVKIDLEGNWIYTPKINFMGIDSFSVNITNESNGSTISTVNILVKDFPKSFDYLNCCCRNY